jgi:hypothetical protein
MNDTYLFYINKGRIFLLNDCETGHRQSMKFQRLNLTTGVRGTYIFSRPEYNWINCPRDCISTSGGVGIDLNECFVYDYQKEEPGAIHHLEESDESPEEFLVRMNELYFEYFL